MHSQWSIILDLPQGQRIFSCKVLQKSGTRSIRLRIRSANSLFLTCPPRFSLKNQKDFILKQSNWISSQLQILAPTTTLLDHLKQNPTLTGSHGPVNVSINLGSPRSIFRFNNNMQTVEFILDERAKVWERDLKHLLLKYAKQILPLRVNHWVTYLSLIKKPKRISVRDQSSRWGSCSQSATLSFNWRLVLLPQNLADYIIHHELAHLTVMNHSNLFWQHLSQLNPAAHNAEKELKKIGPNIIEIAKKNA
jgi:predicted metal-dependent hydrolase